MFSFFIFLLLVFFLSFFMQFFFSIWVFFHNHSRITELKGKGEGISLTPHYNFHPLHRHLDISRETTTESSPLYIGSSRTRTGNLWFLSASRESNSFRALILDKITKCLYLDSSNDNALMRYDVRRGPHPYFGGTWRKMGSKFRTIKTTFQLKALARKKVFC